MAIRAGQRIKVLFTFVGRADGPARCPAILAPIRHVVVVAGVAETAVAVRVHVVVVFCGGRGGDADLAAQFPLQALDLALLGLVCLLGCFVVGSSANELGLLGLDGKHVARVVFDQLSVRILKLEDLVVQPCAIGAYIFGVSS